jgi:hypothetical protein
MVKVRFVVVNMKTKAMSQCVSQWYPLFKISKFPKFHRYVKHPTDEKTHIGAKGPTLAKNKKRNNTAAKLHGPKAHREAGNGIASVRKLNMINDQGSVCVSVYPRYPNCNLFPNLLINHRYAKHPTDDKNTHWGPLAPLW